MKEKNNEYISIIAHELKTPLTSIRWYLSMILEWDMWEISDDARKALNHCYDSSIRLTKLTNDILTLSKIESGKMEYFPENINIVKFLENIYREFFIEIEDRWLILEIEVDKNLKKSNIFIDKDRLKQVFINLIWNAIKFTDSWWKIIIKASKKQKNVLFEIIDTWIWISKENLEKLFDKFNQIDCSLQRNNNCWLWLGLALCKKFIEDFGSKINIESEIWKWSNFNFLLKLTADS